MKWCFGFWLLDHISVAVSGVHVALLISGWIIMIIDWHFTQLHLLAAASSSNFWMNYILIAVERAHIRNKHTCLVRWGWFSHHLALLVNQLEDPLDRIAPDIFYNLVAIDYFTPRFWQNVGIAGHSRYSRRSRYFELFSKIFQKRLTSRYWYCFETFLQIWQNKVGIARAFFFSSSW